MEIHKVRAASLGVLFDTDINVERIPEPFRLQPDLVLTIPYSEYLSFVHSLPRDSKIEMYPSTQVVLEQLQAQSIKNYRSYLLNVAFTICKELHFSAEYNLPPTIYLPSSDVGLPIPWRLYVSQTEAAWKGCGLLQDIMEEYELSFKPTNHDSVRLWCLATVICKVAKTVSTEGVINLSL